MKKISWLENFAESRKKAVEKKKAVKASKKSIANADMIILSKSMLPKAVEGNTVKYKNIKWKVVNASYKDAKGSGVVLKKIAGIDTKPLTSPETRARKDPGDVYDYNVRETSEIPDFEEAARNTEEQIAKEDAVDHDTTPAARYQNDVLKDTPAVEAPISDEEAPVVEDEAPAEEDVPVVEDEATEEAPVEDAPANESPAEELAAENAPAEEATEEVVEEAPAEEEKDDFTFDDVDEEPLDEEAPAEDDEDANKKEDKKASVKHQNRILAAMLKQL